MSSPTTDNIIYIKEENIIDELLEQQQDPNDFGVIEEVHNAPKFEVIKAFQSQYVENHRNVSFFYIKIE